ncbi:MAG: hypothetical protein WC732_04815 [Candidatus Omnitrophota bacterium]
MKKRFAACAFVFLVLWARPLSAEEAPAPFKVRTVLSRDRAFVADTITGRLSVTSEADTDISIAGFPEGIPGLEIIDQDEKIRVFLGKKNTNYRFRVKGFKAGSFMIPPVEIRYRKRGEKNWNSHMTPQTPLVIQTLLEDNEGDRAMRDINGPWLPFDRRFIFAGISAACVMAFLFLRAAKKVKRPECLCPAHVIALRKIRDLEEQDLVSRGLTKEFFYELSLIVRHYLEDRFLLKAPEMTTEEFLAGLKDSQALSLDQKLSLRNFLVSCDRVKFAKYEPKDSEIEGVCQSAKLLIENTKAPETPLEGRS